MSRDIFQGSDHILMSDELGSLISDSAQEKCSVTLNSGEKFEALSISKRIDDVNFIATVTFKSTTSRSSAWEATSFRISLDNQEFHIVETQVDFVTGTASLVGSRPIVNAEVRANGK